MILFCLPWANDSPFPSDSLVSQEACSMPSSSLRSLWAFSQVQVIHWHPLLAQLLRVHDVPVILCTLKWFLEKPSRQSYFVHFVSLKFYQLELHFHQSFLSSSSGPILYHLNGRRGPFVSEFSRSATESAFVQIRRNDRITYA